MSICWLWFESKYELWNLETGKTFMSRCIVFNESVMFIDNSFTDVISDNYDKEQQHISIQVELMDDQEIEIVDNDVHDTV